MQRWLALGGLLLLLACTTTPAPDSGSLETPAPESAGMASAELPPPRYLEARSGELRQVALSWEPLVAGDVAGYRVERSIDGETFDAIAALQGRFHCTFVDHGADLERSGGQLGDGARYLYRVRAVDSRGRLGAASATPAEATTAAPPSPPNGLRTFSHLPRKVALTWEASDDPHVAGYVVSRSPSVRGPFEPIARIDGRFRTRHVDSGLGALRVFYYRVAGVNLEGAEGEPSAPAVAVTKAEPLPPANLHVAEKRLGANELSWEPNVEADVAGYRLLRYRGEDPTAQTVAVLSADQTSALDTDVGAGEVVSYAVVAFDADGLKSAPGDPVRVVCEDYGLTAEVRDGAVHLHWQARADEGFAAARILRRGRVRLNQIARVPSEGFVDREVEPGRSYEYVVSLEREDGSMAPPSAPLVVQVPAASRSEAGTPPAAIRTLRTLARVSGASR